MAAIRVPEELCCAITCDLMRDPVVTSHGQTYDRAAIETYWRTGNVRDPLSNTAVSDTTLTVNFTVRRMIQRLLDEHPSFTVDWPSRELAAARPPVAVEIPCASPALEVQGAESSAHLLRSAQGQLVHERRSGVTIRPDDSIKRIVFDGLGALAFLIVVMIVLARLSGASAVADCGHCLVRASAGQPLAWLPSHGRCEAVNGACVLHGPEGSCVDVSGYVCAPIQTMPEEQPAVHL